MFRATLCPSSGETTVFMRHLVLVILYGWLSGMQGGLEFHSTLHTRQSSIQNNKYQMSHKYSCFSWWWAHSRPKHVEKRNRHTKKNCAPRWLYLQVYTGMYGQQNIKFIVTLCLDTYKAYFSTYSDLLNPQYGFYKCIFTLVADVFRNWSVHG